MPDQKRRRTRSSQRGNAVIEACFIVLPFFSILFLIMDLSMAIFARCTIQHAVQEGLRFGVTSRTFAGRNQDESIKMVVRHQSMGLLTEEDADDKVKVHFYDKNTMALLEDGGGGYSEKANSEGNIIEVCIEDFEWAPLAPLLHSGAPLKMTARSLGRLEPPAGGILPPLGGG